MQRLGKYHVTGYFRPRRGAGKSEICQGVKAHNMDVPEFASKFAHFFIDPDQFPIYDSYAVKMLTYHLNGKGREGLSYEQFAAGFSALKDAWIFP